MQSNTFDLFVIPGALPPVIHLAQYDNARTFEASLKNADGSAYMPPEGVTATFEGTNRLGGQYQIECEVNGANVTFTPDGNATNQWGRTAATITLRDGDDQITALNIIVDVQRAGVTNEEAAENPGFTDRIAQAIAEYGAYRKPSGGIPASDLASAVQTSLGKADGAVQKSAQAAKTAGMTNRVGIDGNGVLWSVAGGGSGGGVTKYTVTLSGSASPYTASMSSSEIYSAVQGGNIVEAVIDGEMLTLSKSTSSAAIFVGHALTENEFIGLALAISGNAALTTPIPIQTKGIADAAGYFTNDTVEGALAEIGAQLDGLEAALTALL